METNKYIEKVLGDFEREFCNNHQKPIRFKRAIFFDEQDGSEKIEKFIQQALLKQQEIIKECYNNSVTYEGFVDKLKARGINLE